MNSTLGPRNLGDILSETFRIYGRNFLRLLAIVAIVEVVLGILAFFLLTPMGVGDRPELLPQFIIIAVVLLAGYIVAYPLMVGALIYAISEQHFQQPVSIGRGYHFAWGRIGALIGATILAGLAVVVMAATIIGIPAAIYFSVRWAFVCQVVLLEGLGPIAALSRSSALVKGNWWRVLGIMLVVGIIAAVISSILGTIPRVGSIIGGILSTPVAITGATLLYYDLRVRKEEYTLETLSGELHLKTNSDIT